MVVRVRISNVEYYLGIAEAVSKRADCVRAQVGAVIVINDRIWAAGRNGTKNRGEPGCMEGACPRATSGVEPYSDYSNCIAVHAEINALDQFQELLNSHDFGPDWGPWDMTNPRIMYINREPCSDCAKQVSDQGFQMFWRNQ